MEKIKLYKVYFVFNKDLGLERNVAGHEVVVVKFNKDKKKVKVKTITSIEGNPRKDGMRKMKSSSKDLIEELYKGNIILIPHKYLNTPKLSGVVVKGIWVDVDKLLPNKYNTKFPLLYKKIIGK